MSILRAWIAAWLGLISGAAWAGSSVPVAFYVNWDTETTFYTVTPEEIDRFGPQVPYQGWNRYDTLPSVGSTYSFRAWRGADSAPPDAVPVCRFYWPARGMHFFTGFAFECAGLIASGGPWILEDPAAFYVWLPDALTGSCPPDAAPAYRFEQYGDHLFVASLAERTRLLGLAQSMTPEGYGPLGVGFCSPID